MNLKNYFNKIYIDKKVVKSPISENVLKEFNQTPVFIVNKPPFSEKLSEGKKILYLTENNSTFLKKCPGTPNYLCCNYNVLHLAEHCPMDCSYCILQVYFKNPYLTLFTNTDLMLNELYIAKKRGEIVRIGTGEFTDSFALAKIGNWNETLIPFFAKCKNMFLELKSKAADREFLRFKNHNRRIIISFSLNTLKIQQEEEKNTSTVSARLNLAKEALEAGFINSFHFDPIIDYCNCEKDYDKVINMLFDVIDERNICWISLGSLRFIPQLKEIATKRFRKTRIYAQEFHTGLDGKYRYFVKRRIEIYRAIVHSIKKRSPKTPLYFCMESEKVWNAVFGYAPKNNEELSKFLDNSVKKVANNF